MAFLSFTTKSPLLAASSFLLALSTLGVAQFAAPSAHAACLGLSAPVPRTTNICETLFKELVVPRTEVFCKLEWWQRAIAPHCNIPGACHVDPVCKAFERSRTVTAILNAGDAYCDAREMHPEEMIKKIGDGAFSDLTTLTTGGVSSVLYDVANRHIDQLACSGKPLPDAAQRTLKCLRDAVNKEQDTGVLDVDIERNRIVNRSTKTASIYLPEDKTAITLDDVVIYQPLAFERLSNWSKEPTDELSEEEIRTIVLALHELVHVGQYRRLGKESFLNNYLANVLIHGYGSDRFEKEAYGIGDLARAYLRENGRCKAPEPEPEPEPAPRPCFGAVQDKIAWNYHGSTRWDVGNIVRLCNGQEDSTAPAQCFQEAMHGNTGANPRWSWQEASALCEGTADANRTLSCYLENEGELGRASAILKCNTQNRCFNAVQGRVSWVVGSNTHLDWASSNVENLCKGREFSTTPVACFEAAMRGDVGAQPGWYWQDAIDLCQGTANPQATLDCYRSKMGELPKQEAIDACRASRTCFNSVQGKISWLQGDERAVDWVDSNVEDLCRGQETTTEPGRCFETVMSGAIGPDPEWNWATALDLCKGAASTEHSTACYEKKRETMSRGQAIAQCVASRTCFDAVQGEISWVSGSEISTRWNDANVRALCEGQEHSTAPAQCFRLAMQGNISRGDGSSWRWMDARDLCRGATNAYERVSCFQDEVGVSGWSAAIETCAGAR